jgi:hypothetical protein
VNAGPARVEALRAAALPSSTTSYSGRHRPPDPPASQPCRRSAEPARCVWPRRGHATDVDDVPRVVLDEVVVQRSYICGVSQLGQGVRLNLPDPLSGHPISPADLLEAVGLAVGQPEPQLTTPASRSDRVASTDCSWSCSGVKLTASTATTALLRASRSSRSPSHSGAAALRRGAGRHDLVGAVAVAESGP